MHWKILNSSETHWSHTWRNRDHVSLLLIDDYWLFIWFCFICLAAMMYRPEDLMNGAQADGAFGKRTDVDHVFLRFGRSNR